MTDDFEDVDMVNAPPAVDASRVAQLELQYQQELHKQKQAELEQQMMTQNQNDAIIQSLRNQLQEKDAAIKKKDESLKHLVLKTKQANEQRKDRVLSGIIGRRSRPRSLTKIRLPKQLPPALAAMIEAPPPAAISAAPLQLMLDAPSQQISTVITDEIRRDLLERKGNDNFFTAAIRQYGHVFDLSVMHDQSALEIVLLYELDPSLGLKAIRLEISTDSGLAHEQLTMVVQELEGFERTTASDLRAGVLQPGMVQKTNKNPDDLFQICQTRRKCYIGTEGILQHIHSLSNAVTFTGVHIQDDEEL